MKRNSSVATWRPWTVVRAVMGQPRLERSEIKT